MSNDSPKIDLNNLDKSGWKTYRFDEICQSISERIDPTTTDLDTYIGLEHLDSESIHIRRTGKPSDVKGQKLRFYPGDVIFGKRRAYQRKAAVATMHGFCSAHAMVLRANPEVIDPQLFPFFLHSDTFMDRAVDISVGSLSPTINWKTLSKQKYPLPPKEEQKTLFALLHAADNLVQANLSALRKVDLLTQSYRSEVFTRSEWPEIKLKNLFSVQLGKMLSPKAKLGINSFPYLANANVQWDSFDLSKLSEMDFSEKDQKKYSLQYGDLLICEGGDVGRSAVWKNERSPCFYQKALHRLRPLTEMSSEVMLQFMLWGKSAGIFTGHTGHSTIAHLTASTLKELTVPVPPPSEIPRIEKQFASLKSITYKSDETIENSRVLQKSLSNQIF